jgi:DNA polymerase-4
VIVPPDFSKYRDVSRAMFGILRAHAEVVEGLSLDEAFCDLGAIGLDEARSIAARIKASVHESTGLTISVGVAAAKIVAKIASDDGKPDGLVCVEPGAEAEFLAQKPVGRLWGVGPKTEARLRAAGIERIGQLAALDDERSFALFGRYGREMRDLARGIDRRRVSDDDSVRSISSEETFEHDVTEVRALVTVVRTQAAELSERLRHRGLRAMTVGVKLKLADFSVHGRQTTLSEPTDDARIIAAAAAFCVRKAGVENARVRLVGTKVAALGAAGAKQISLFEEPASGAPQGSPAIPSNPLP